MLGQIQYNTIFIFIQTEFDQMTTSIFGVWIEILLMAKKFDCRVSEFSKIINETSLIFGNKINLKLITLSSFNYLLGYPALLGIFIVSSVSLSLCFSVTLSLYLYVSLSLYMTKNLKS